MSRNPKVNVTMDREFYEALTAFAASVDRTPANVLLHAGKAFLSKHHAWHAGTRGRPFARVRIGNGEAIDNTENAPGGQSDASRAGGEEETARDAG